MSYRIRSVYREDDSKGIPAFRENAMTHPPSIATTPITKTIAATELDANQITVDVIYSDATVVGSVTAIIESSADGGLTFDHSHGSVVITAQTATRTTKSIDLSMDRSGDQSSLPLRPQFRVSIVGTNVADTVVVDELHISTRSRG